MRWAVPLLVLGCSNSTSPALAVEVRGAGGALPPAFRVVVADGEEVHGLTCPEVDSSDVARCTDTGFELWQARPGLQLTVAGRGHQFRELSLEPPLHSPLVIELSPLPPFEATAAYRTGFGADAGESAFVELAVQAETDLGPAQLVKFYVQLGEEPLVYFQNTRRYARHHDFARDVLGATESLGGFADQTYRGADRRAFAGTLSYVPGARFSSGALQATATAPVLLEFFPSDDLSPEQVRLVYRLLAERLEWLSLSGAERRLHYLPAGSTQEAQLVADAAAFTRREMAFSTRVELYAALDRQYLNPGITFGRLRHLSPEQLATTLVSHRDVLLLERLPNDVPLAGGTITAELQTPLSHVNLTARARGTPNLALLDPLRDERVASLVGKLVRLEVSAGSFDLREATLEEAEAFWQARSHVALTPVSDVSLQGLPSFEQLGFEDAPRVGSKAANLAELRRLLGSAAPDGFAIPFSAYDGYLRSSQVTTELCERADTACHTPSRAAEVCTGAGRRCGEAAAAAESYADFAARLLGDPALSADTALREASLATLAFLIRHGALSPELADELDRRVLEQFGSAQVRLRSSTNVEDLPGFSGAGLYRSVSARSAGAERASLRVREVWASAWSFRAFEERSFWNIDHRQIQVGVAVNRAVDREVANGVLITQDLARPGAEGLYVNVQRGELEVTNPEGGALPEVFSILEGPDGTRQVARQRFSSLSPDQPLLSDVEITQLAALSERVQLRFAELYAVSPRTLALDLEFKLLGAERQLQLKQVRPYSAPTPGQ